jgi:transposase
MLAIMFLRATIRKKDGKLHRYYSVVENRRLKTGKIAQRTVLYLGEINDAQEAAWRKTLDVFDEHAQGPATLSLFPEDRKIPADAVDAIQVKLSEMQLKRPRSYGDCWLACEIWNHLGMCDFWNKKIPISREDVAWAKVLQLLVVNRMIDPGSEFRLHRQWFDGSAMDELLGEDFTVAEKDRLYRCLDRVLEHKKDLFLYLKDRWRTLFNPRFEVLLYDLTSTYFEGQAEQNPKAKRGYSRDGRPDCLQVVIALVVTTDGFPLAYEVMDGNTSDKTTLRGFLEKIEFTYGKADRMWVMDRGIPTEEVLEEMRKPDRQTQYLVGTPRARINAMEKKWLDLPWQKVRDSVEVKLWSEGGELFVLAKSEGRRQKEMAMRRRRLVQYLHALRRMRHSLPSRDQLMMRIGAARSRAGRAAAFVQINLPAKDEAVTRDTFRFKLDREKFDKAELRDGHYLLRSNVTGGDPAELWERYIQLTEIESVFKTLKSDLAIRPIHHQLEHRVDAHIFVAFLAYCVMVTLKKRLQVHAPGLTPKAVLEKMATIQMLDVWLPTTDGRTLIMSRYTQPETDLLLLLRKLGLRLPEQPLPRIRNGQNVQIPKPLIA